METLAIGLERVFVAALAASWQAAALILVVLAVQRLCRGWMAPRWRHALWLVVVARLALPWTPQSPLSLFQFLPDAGYVGGRLTGAFAPDMGITDAPWTDADQKANHSGNVLSGNSIRRDGSLIGGGTPPALDSARVLGGVVDDIDGMDEIDGKRRKNSLIFWAALAWLLGTAALSAIVAAQSWRLHRAVSRRHRPLANQSALDLLEECKAALGVRAPLAVIETPDVQSPALYSLVRPRLLLPEGAAAALGPAGLRHVFLHELAHLRRRDILVNWLAAFVQIVHWFNPLVWLAMARLRAERELACDALALTHAPAGESAAYGRTMISLLENFARPPRLPGLAGIVEEHTFMRRRITMIANFAKEPRRAMPPALALIALLAFAGLTSAQNKAEKIDPNLDAARRAAAQAALPLTDPLVLPEGLTDAQRLYGDWTHERFRDALDLAQFTGLSDATRAELEAKWMDELKGPKDAGYYQAINALGTIQSRAALEPLIQIAAERVEKDNRDRWMAARAIGLIGEVQAIPSLFPLVYHYNQNTRFWAQISLVRLSGQNFGGDWEKWAAWWNAAEGEPIFDGKKVEWPCSQPEWNDPAKQAVMDAEFLAKMKQAEEQLSQEMMVRFDAAQVEKAKGQAAAPPTTDTKTDAAKGTWIVAFRPVAPFDPKTAVELLAAFNENHPKGVTTHHFRTRTANGQYVGFICVDTEAGKDAVVEMLKASQKIIHEDKAELATPEMLNKLYELGQPDKGAPDSQRSDEAAPSTGAPRVDDLMAATEKEITEHYSAAHPEVQEYIRWTSRTFGPQFWLPESAFDHLTPAQREDKIAYLAQVLEGEYGRHLCTALTEAGVLKDAKLYEGVRKAALYHRDDADYDCRPKWMAVAALGRFDDEKAVPDLIPLVDHGNQNTRMWARASLARLTGQNFNDDKKAWGQWWNDSGHEPAIDVDALKPWAPPTKTE